ncbi:hypothetical protein [Prevotella histicola]|jgi:hypothetical protein
MDKAKEVIIYIIVLASLIMSIFSLCNSLPRTDGLDYIGVIVGILSLLVTILIGWNIYTVIDFNKKKEELSKNEAVLSDLILRVNNNTTADSAALEFYFAYLYAYLLTNNEPFGLGFWYINHTLNAILKYSEIAKYKECNALVEMLLSTITEPQKIKVNKKRKDDLLKLVLGIHGISNIDKYSNVLSFVSNLGE